MDTEQAEPLEEPPQKRVRLQEEATTAGLAQPSTNIPVNPGPQSDYRSKEERCGIRSLVRAGRSSFNGTLKQRYTDFLVNEILPDGTVLHLKSLQIPKKQTQGDHDIRAAPTEVSGTAPANTDLPDLKAHENPVENAAGSNKSKEFTEPTTVQQGDVSNEELEALKVHFGGDTAEKIIQLHRDVVANPGRKPVSFPKYYSPVIDRQTRTLIHQLVRRIFSSRLDTVTQDDGTIAVSATPRRSTYHSKESNSTAPNGQKTSTRGPNKLGWEAQGGEYLHFTLHKENKDTMEIISFLGAQMKVPPKRFAFAGTKDRRAVTVQRCCVFRMSAGQLQGTGKRLRGSAIGDFEHKPSGLDLGDLGGNAFTITLRDAQVEPNVNGAALGVAGEHIDAKQKRLEEILNEVVPSFQHNGFLNYYGLQRFGSMSVPTHAIGMKMLRNDIKGAVDDILHVDQSDLPKENDENTATPSTETKPQTQPNKISTENRLRTEGIKAWRASFDTDIRASLDAAYQVPKKFHAESQLMKFLAAKDGRKKNDHQGAMMTLPRNLRLMYVHAYQSFVFNYIVSERWERYGATVISGDLVLIEKGQTDTAKDEANVDQDGETILDPGERDSANFKEDEIQRARPLSAEEAASGRYNIFDIVLPLPGFDVVYPPNDIGEAYESFMQSEEGGKLDCHNMRRGWKDVSLSGGYRRIVAKPVGDVSWRIARYSRAEDQLVETDLESIKRKEREAKGEQLVVGQQDPDGDVVMGSKSTTNVDEAKPGLQAPEEQNEKLAVILNLSLGPSTYATMALRELMGPGGCREWKPDFAAPAA